MHECPTCGEVFQGRSALGRHHSSEHGLSIREYERLQKLGEDTVVCPTCDREFGSSRVMKIHHQKIHGESLAGATIKCEWCGNKKTVAPHEKEGARFCSKECDAKWRSHAYQGENHPNWSHVTFECAHCGEEKERITSRLNDHGRSFCSPECRDEFNTKRWAGEENPNWNGEVEVSCEWCGETRSLPPSHAAGRRFCSRPCYEEWYSDTLVGEESPHWQGGSFPYGPGWNEGKKEAIRKRDGYGCQSCGLSQEEHRQQFGRKLSVHHITPAREFDNPEARNAMENLITLCIECHRQWEQMAPLRPDTATATSD